MTAIALDGESIVMVGALDGALGVIVAAKAGGTPPRSVLEDETLTFVLRVADRNAYVMAEPDAFELLSVSIDTLDVPALVRGDLTGDAFLIDGCVAVVNSMEGDLIRTPL